MTDRFTADAATHPGAVRARNEDSILARPDWGLWVVADGAGGHGGGAEASQAAIGAIAHSRPGTVAELRTRLLSVHGALQRRAGAGATMATTIVALLLQGSAAQVAWSGDSRAYLLRGGLLQQLTHDHSLVQQLLDQGSITAEQAASHPQSNVILHAVGAQGAFRLDEATVTVRAGDALLLCSDGLYRSLPGDGLADLLRAGATADGLVQAAVAARARDNVSAALVRIDH